jgi:TolA-binding protein
MKHVLTALILAAATPAFAQKPAGELQVNTVRGPAQELYIRKRPSSPEAPILSKDLKELLTSTEKRRDDKRIEAIGLLKQFLDSKPTGDAKAEGMFKLAELLWEEARRLYLIEVDAFSRAVEKCNQKKTACEPPKEPRIDLKQAEALYVELHAKHPNFRRMDLVTYLIGFAAKEDQREDEAMKLFNEVIEKYPRSSLQGDAWMMIGEHHFALQKWEEAKAAYKHIPDEAATSDLATFKVAWCEWKLGNTTQAAKDFKRVLDKAVEAERTGTAAQRRRSASLRDEALEQLVVVFTEDKSVSAKEVFDFLASIGGEQYSRDVLLRVAESYGAQTEWERSNEAYRFLIKMDPESIKSAEYQRDIVGNWNAALDVDKAQEGDQGAARGLRPDEHLGQGAEESRRARALAADHRGADALDGDQHPRRGAAPREGAQPQEARRRLRGSPVPHQGPRGLLHARRRGVRQLPRGVRRPEAIEREDDRGALLPRRHPVLQAGEDRGGRRRVPRGRQERPRRQAPQGCVAQRDERVREGAPEGHRRQGQAVPRRQEVRRGDRHLRQPVQERPDDRRRAVQERPDVLRLRRVRRGDQALRPDRHRVREGHQRGPRR